MITFHFPWFVCLRFYSILFYSILFYSILFYSILFYSILFYSIQQSSDIWMTIFYHFVVFVQDIDRNTSPAKLSVSISIERNISDILVYLWFCFVLFVSDFFFCFVLLCFVFSFSFFLFCFVLFCFVLFCILFCFVLFCFKLFDIICIKLIRFDIWFNWIFLNKFSFIS